MQGRHRALVEVPRTIDPEETEVIVRVVSDYLGSQVNIDLDCICRVPRNCNSVQCASKKPYRTELRIHIELVCSIRKLNSILMKLKLVSCMDRPYSHWRQWLFNV